MFVAESSSSSTQTSRSSFVDANGQLLEPTPAVILSLTGSQTGSKVSTSMPQARSISGSSSSIGMLNSPQRRLLTPKRGSVQSPLLRRKPAFGGSSRSIYSALAAPSDLHFVFLFLSGNALADVNRENLPSAQNFSESSEGLELVRYVLGVKVVPLESSSLGSQVSESDAESDCHMNFEVNQFKLHGSHVIDSEDCLFTVSEKSSGQKSTNCGKEELKIPSDTATHSLSRTIDYSEVSETESHDEIVLIRVAGSSSNLETLSGFFVRGAQYSLPGVRVVRDTVYLPPFLRLRANEDTLASRITFIHYPFLADAGFSIHPWFTGRTGMDAAAREAASLRYSLPKLLSPGWINSLSALSAAALDSFICVKAMVVGVRNWQEHSPLFGKAGIHYDLVDEYCNLAHLSVFGKVTKLQPLDTVIILNSVVSQLGPNMWKQLACGKDSCIFVNQLPYTDKERLHMVSAYRDNNLAHPIAFSDSAFSSIVSVRKILDQSKDRNQKCFGRCSLKFTGYVQPENDMMQYHCVKCHKKDCMDLAHQCGKTPSFSFLATIADQASDSSEDYIAYINETIAAELFGLTAAEMINPDIISDETAREIIETAAAETRTFQAFVAVSYHDSLERFRRYESSTSARRFLIQLYAITSRRNSLDQIFQNFITVSQSGSAVSGATVTKTIPVDAKSTYYSQKVNEDRISAKDRISNDIVTDTQSGSRHRTANIDSVVNDEIIEICDDTRANFSATPRSTPLEQQIKQIPTPKTSPSALSSSDHSEEKGEILAGIFISDDEDSEEHSTIQNEKALPVQRDLIYDQGSNDTTRLSATTESDHTPSLVELQNRSGIAKSTHYKRKKKEKLTPTHSRGLHSSKEDKSMAKRTKS